MTRTAPSPMFPATMWVTPIRASIPAMSDLQPQPSGESTLSSEAISPEQLTITPEERGAMLKKLFDAKFPPGTKFGTPLPKPPAVAPPPPKPQPGMVKRIVNAITFQDARNRRAAEKEQARTAEELKKATATAVAEGLPPDVMNARLAETMEINDNDLRALAMARAAQVRDYLSTTGKIAPERLFLAKMSTATPTKQNQGPRVFFELQ